jgi:hypothetical protein
MNTLKEQRITMFVYAGLVLAYGILFYLKYKDVNK